MYTTLPDAPQGIGDLIGIAFRLTRRNIGEIFRFILVPSIFTLAAGIMTQWVFTYGTAAVTESKSFSAAASLAGFALIALAALAISWWYLGQRLLALTRIVLGFSDSLTEALSYAGRRKWALAGLYLLFGAIGVGAMMAWALMMFAGIFAGGFASTVAGQLVSGLIVFVTVTVGLTGIFSTAALYMLSSHIALCVLACENLPVTGVIGRALKLTFRNFWRALAFGFVFMVAFSIISYPLSLPVAVVTFADALQHGLASAGQSGSAAASAYKPPLYLLILTQVWEAGMGILLRPLVFFSFGLLYYDMRLRGEGLDIRRKLQLVEAKEK